MIADAFAAIAAQRWAQQAPAVTPWLHEEVARRMVERLQWIKQPVQAWAHWSPVRGGLQTHQQIVQRYPQAQIYAVETQAHLQQAAREALTPAWWQWRRPRPQLAMPPSQSVDMVWDNMQLHTLADPQQRFKQWHDALREEGFVMFSCLGPDSLRELRQLYAHAGWPPAMSPLTDMHDWGDRLVHAGFAEPVMDMEYITLSFETIPRLLQELREWGRNFHPQRFAGLRTPGWREQLQTAWAREFSNPYTLTLEVIYGHALKPQARLQAAQAYTTVPLQVLRDSLKKNHEH